MSLSAYALCTLAQLETYMGISSGDWDAALESLIEAVSAQAEAYTGRKLAARDYSWRKNGNGLTELLVDEYPLNSISTLEINGTAISASATPELWTAGYVIEADEGLVRLIGYEFTKGIQNIEISANAGYASGSRGAVALQQAAIEWAAWKVKESGIDDVGAGIFGKESDAKPQGMGTVSWDLGAPPRSVKAVLDVYKRRGGL